MKYRADSNPSYTFFEFCIKSHALFAQDMSQVWIQPWFQITGKGFVMSKKIVLLLSGLMWMAPFAAKAQERGEISVSGGYSQQRELFSAMHGWDASVAGNVMKHLALVGDFSGYYNSDTFFQTKNEYRNFSYFFGPRYTHTIGSRWTPFAHFMLGGYHATRHTSGSSSFSGSQSTSWFALDLGFGFDIRVSKRFSVRPLQLDLERLSNRDSKGYFGRATFGVVYRLTGSSRQ
jgi:hypothetical protein